MKYVPQSANVKSKYDLKRDKQVYGTVIIFTGAIENKTLKRKMPRVFKPVPTKPVKVVTQDQTLITKVVTQDQTLITKEKNII